MSSPDGCSVESHPIYYLGQKENSDIEMIEKLNILSSHYYLFDT